MTDVNLCQEAKTCIHKAGKETLQLTADVLLDLMYIDAKLKPEWAVVLLGGLVDDPIAGHGCMVSAIYMPRQHVSAATFEFVDAWHIIEREIAAQPKFDGLQIIGTLHRHPGSMSSYSSVDSDSVFASFPVGALLHDGSTPLSRITAYTRVQLPCNPNYFKMQTMDVLVLFDQTTDWDAVVKEAIVERKVQASAPSPFQGARVYTAVGASERKDITIVTPSTPSPTGTSISESYTGAYTRPFPELSDEDVLMISARC